MARIIIETTEELKNKIKSESAKRGMTIKEFMLNLASKEINKEGD